MKNGIPDSVAGMSNKPATACPPRACCWPTCYGSRRTLVRAIVGVDVDGIVMLPVPLILKSDNYGEQEMVVSSAREIGEGDGNTRSFALYTFCKD
jgi:hypothetical protein